MARRLLKVDRFVGVREKFKTSRHLDFSINRWLGHKQMCFAFSLIEGFSTGDKIAT